MSVIHILTRSKDHFAGSGPEIEQGCEHFYRDFLTQSEVHGSYAEAAGLRARD